MAAVNLLMADRAVLVARRTQIVECRRYHSRHANRVIRRQVGMALEAYEAHLLPRQHARVCGAVRFMASGATFEAHRLVFECEWTALIAVAIQTSGFVCAKALLHRGANGTVRIVAIHAAHGVLRQLV